jgi:hypothetical protein
MPGLFSPSIRRLRSAGGRTVRAASATRYGAGKRQVEFYGTLGISNSNTGRVLAERDAIDILGIAVPVPRSS